MLPLLLLPALCCDADLYEPIVEGLQDLVSPRTIIPAEPTIVGSAHSVLAQEDGPFVVLGTSFGGQVAREVALAAPGRVKGLCIIGAGAGPVTNPAAGKERGEKLRDGRAEEVYQQFAEMIAYLPGPNGEAARDRFLAMARRGDPLRSARQNDGLVTRPDRWDALAGIACPTLLIWGRYDKFSAAAEGLRMAGSIPKARYVEIPDCGHLPTLEAPEESLQALRHWLLDAGLAKM